jgi:hypothetical protein
MRVLGYTAEHNRDWLFQTLQAKAYCDLVLTIKPAPALAERHLE